MNTFRVKVTPGAKAEGVCVGKDGRLLVSVRAKRERGAANDRMRELLARHFGVPTDAIVLRAGHTSATKTVVIRET